MKQNSEFQVKVYRDSHGYYASGVTKYVSCGIEKMKEVYISTTYDQLCPGGAEKGSEVPSTWPDALLVVKLRTADGVFLYVDKTIYDTNVATCNDCCDDAPQLGTPANLTASQGGDEEVVLDWDDVANAESYTVERSTSNSFTSPTVVYTGSVSGYTDNTGLTNGTKYYYRVKATAAFYTDSEHAVVDATPLDPQLATPANLVVTPGAGQNALDWDDVAGADNYKVFQDTDFTFGSEVEIYSGATSAHTETSLTPGTQYFYRVVAQGAGYRDSESAYGDGTPS